MMSDTVRAWSEPVSIPTYGIGAPNPNPMFLEKRVYQGSSGAVYPYPVVDHVDDQKHDQIWTAVYLENEFIKLMILPQLGGRVQMALDKTNNYHFVYHNQVIKPALVGLTGPWISGGIEFNWPQHHRPSTYEPVDWTIEEHDDGSCTVWCAENERMFRTRGRHGFTVYPGRSGFDVRVHLYNGTSEPQTFLWWANPAVHVNDDYQSIFPPDVHAVMDHGKRDVSDFPIATGIYYKQNYAPGTDISRYRNIAVPTSYMAYHSDYNFVGCYDHGPQAGMLHVANHHLVPGKKQWTWGHGDFGRAWDRQLTDEDGPYIELMCGAFTDNQPDFTWLMPGEEKSFTQTFMPYKQIGPVHNASRDFALNLTCHENQVQLGLYAAVTCEVRLELWHNPAPNPSFHNHKNMRLASPLRPLAPQARRLLVKPLNMSAASVWSHQLTLDAPIPPQELTVRILAQDGEEVRLAYSPPGEATPDIPSPATPAQAPAEIASNEELYLNGLHLEQYRHATYAPEPYYEEVLRRDPGDSRCHLALGRLQLRRGLFGEAETHFRAAIQRLTLRNPNPSDGEAYYNLGLALRFQARYEEAFDAFYKAVWSEAWKSPAYFELARLASRAGRVHEALELIDESLARNTRHQKARHLRGALLRQAGRSDDARACALEALHLDPLDPGALHELILLQARPAASEDSSRTYNFLELGIDYLHAGFWKEAADLFARLKNDDCLAPYFLAETLRLQGEDQRAAKVAAQAAASPLPFAFPHVLECVPLLQAAMKFNSEDARAAYALGNFWYAHRKPEEAIACWESCTRVNPSFPTAWRNLGLAYMNKRHDQAAAGQALTRAFDTDQNDARVLFELDQFHKETGAPVAERLARLDRHRTLVLERDDLCVEYLHLLNLQGRSAEALEVLTSRIFHPWEGGEGKTSAQYLRSQIQLVEQEVLQQKLEQALDRLRQAEVVPATLGEGKLAGTQDNELRYRRGILLEMLGRSDEARTSFEAATQGISEPASAMYYNDQPPESIYFQGLAWRKLGQEERAQAIFNKLIDYADTHGADQIQMDYFAVSLPDFLVFDVDLSERNRRHCLFMRTLGLAGLGRTEEARAQLQELMALVPDHQAWLLLPELDAIT